MSETSVSNAKIIEELKKATDELVKKHWSEIEGILISEAEISLSMSHEIKLTGDGSDVKTKIGFAKKYADSRKGKVFADGQGDLFPNDDPQEQEGPEESEDRGPKRLEAPKPQLPAPVGATVDAELDEEGSDE